MTTATIAESQTILMDVMAYICKRYSSPEELSKARLTKLIYLADWRSAKTKSDNSQITNIKWYFNHYGPYVDDVVDVIIDHEDTFKLDPGTNIYGGVRDLVRLKKADYEYGQLQREEDKKLLDEIITRSAGLNWTRFIDLVYSSYPITVSERYAQLDLPALAREYKERESKPHFELIADDI